MKKLYSFLLSVFILINCLAVIQTSSKSLYTDTYFTGDYFIRRSWEKFDNGTTVFYDTKYLYDVNETHIKLDFMSSGGNFTLIDNSNSFYSYNLYNKSTGDFIFTKQKFYFSDQYESYNQTSIFTQSHSQFNLDFDYLSSFQNVTLPSYNTSSVSTLVYVNSPVPEGSRLIKIELNIYETFTVRISSEVLNSKIGSIDTWRINFLSVVRELNYTGGYESGSNDKLSSKSSQTVNESIWIGKEFRQTLKRVNYELPACHEIIELKFISYPSINSSSDDLSSCLPSDNSSSSRPNSLTNSEVENNGFSSYYFTIELAIITCFTIFKFKKRI